MICPIMYIHYIYKSTSYNIIVPNYFAALPSLLDTYIVCFPVSLVVCQIRHNETVEIP